MVISRDYKTVEFLIKEGANVHIVGPEGESAYSLMQEKQLHRLLELIEARDPTPTLSGTIP